MEEIKYRIAVGPSVKRPEEWRNAETVWDVMKERLSKVVRTMETMEEWHKMTKDVRGPIKDVGGFIGGPMEVEGDRHADNVRVRSLLCIDVDGTRKNGKAIIPDVKKVLEVLDGYGYLYAMHQTHTSTPEWPRLRVIMPLSREVGPVEYGAIARRFMEKIGLLICDPCSAEHARVMFWPSVPKDAPYELMTGGDRPVDVDEILATYVDYTNVAEWPGMDEAVRRAAISRHMKVGSDGHITAPEEKNGTIGRFCRLWDIHGAITAFGLPYRSAGHSRYTYTDGSGYAGAIVYEDGRWLFSFHMTDPARGQLCNAFDLVRIHRYGDLDRTAAPDTPITRMPSFIAMVEYAESLPEMKEALGREIRASFEDAADTEGDGKAARSARKGKAVPVGDDWEKGGESVDLDGETPSEGGNEAPEWTAGLDMKGNNLKPTANNYNLLLSNLPDFRGAFRKDIFAYRRQVVRALPWDTADQTFPRDFTDTDRSELAVYFSSNKAFPVNGGKDALNDALEKQFNATRVHPVREFLRALPEWDGQERIGTLFHRYLGSEDTELNRAIARKHLTAAVKRVMEPACKYEQVLVLVGPEGTGKSSIIEKLSMGWYQDSNIDVGSKDAYQNLIGYWLIEMAELADYASKSVEFYKNFISSTVDRFRPPYGRETVSVPRQSVFFATTNENDFLKGRTGNRRFWVLDCPGSEAGRDAIFDGTLEAELPQIWAEALHCYRQKMSLIFDNSQREAMRIVQAGHEILQSDETKALILEYSWRKKPCYWRSFTLPEKIEWLKSRTIPIRYAGEGEMPLQVVDYICARELLVLVFNKKADVSTSPYDSKNLCYVLNNMPELERTGSVVRFGEGLGRQKAYRVLPPPSTEDENA